MKVMFYCQHVQGISHLVRSAEIARALSHRQMMQASSAEAYYRWQV